MGGLISHFVKRPLRQFNIDNRAAKVISREKPTPAPRHPTTAELTADYQKTSKIKKEESKDLLQRLKSVYVESKNVQNEYPMVHTSRPLPSNRQVEEDPEYGVMDTDKVPIGKFSLKQAQEFLSEHQKDPNLWNSTMIANEYKLDSVSTQEVLKFFKTFDIYFPDTKEKVPLLPRLFQDIKLIESRSRDKTSKKSPVDDNPTSSK